MTQTLLAECIDITRGLAGSQILCFADVLVVKPSPHKESFIAHGVCASSNHDLYLMAGDGDWHKVEDSQVSSSVIIKSLYQRLCLLRFQYAKILNNNG